MTPHKHCAVIKAWAEGAVIQHRYKINRNTARERWSVWEEIQFPTWYDNADNDYRVKPEPKPDVVGYGRVYFEKSNYPLASPDRIYLDDGGLRYTQTDNVKFIFDGETNKLKEVKIL